MSGREKGVWLRLQNDFVCVCKEREGVSRPAEREILILVFVDGAVRSAVGDVDVSVRGKILSAGLIAEGASCHARPPRRANRQAGRLSRSGCLSQQFPGLIESKQYKCVPPLAPDPITPRGFPPAPSISAAAETYYCVLSEAALAPDLFSECIPSILLSRIVYIYFFSWARTCMTEVTCAH